MLLEYLIAQFESGLFGSWSLFMFPCRQKCRQVLLFEVIMDQIQWVVWLVLLSRAGRVVVNFLPALMFMFQFQFQGHIFCFLVEQRTL